MGLDARAYAVKGDEKIELAYWRKHYSLNEFVWSREEGYAGVAGSLENIGVERVLDKNDLHEMRDAVQILFSYEPRKIYKNSQVKDYKFIRLAESKIRDGYEILYESV